MKDSLYYSWLLLLSVLMIDIGVRKYFAKRIYYNRKFETTLFWIFLSLPSIFRYISWQMVRIELQVGQYALYDYLPIILVYGIVPIFFFSKDLITKKVTIYNIEKSELLEIVNLLLTNLGIEFEHRIVRGVKNIYKVNNGKVKIIVKENITVFPKNEGAVLILRRYDLFETSEFLNNLKVEVFKKSNETPTTRGIEEIIAGIGFILLYVFSVR